MSSIPAYITIPETDSTNRFAHDWLSQNETFEHGTAIMSFYQTAGKGQKNNHWESERGANLLTSVILKMDFLEASSVNLLNQAVAISICDFLQQQCGVDFKVKWPNDIMHGEHKIAGVLIENTIRGSKCYTSVVGVGINLHQTQFKSYVPKATSLKLITNTTIDSIESFAQDWRQQLLDKIAILQNDGRHLIEEAYKQKLFGRDEFRWFESENNRFKGCIKGVDNHGHLIISTEEGEWKFGLKEIKFLFEE